MQGVARRLRFSKFDGGELMALDRHLFADKLGRYMTQFQVAPTDVSVGTGINADRIKEMLCYNIDPTGDEILIIADYFKCDFKFFISSERLAPFEQTEALFRKHGSELTADDRWAIQEFLFLCECQQFLLDELHPGSIKPFAFKKKGGYFKTHGEEAAFSLRRHLGLAAHEIPQDIFKVFRKIGQNVFRRKLGTSSISGLFVRHPVAGNCVLVNDDEDLFRQRFTVAHEVGHALLDTEQDFVVSFNKWDKNDLSELRANVFASRFLLPPETLSIIPEPQTWTETKFLEYATRFMVNTATLAYALQAASLIGEHEVKAFEKLRVAQDCKTDTEFSLSLSVSSKRRKAALLERGLSDSYVGLCLDAYDQSIVTASRLAEMLLVPEPELTEVASLYGRTICHAS